MSGRPPLTDEEKNEIVQKLEPYLKAGLSIRKACLEAQIPKSSVYDYLGIDEQFSDKIHRVEQSVSVRIAMTLSGHLDAIEKRVGEGKELNNDDISFVKWYATASSKTKEEFAKKEEVGNTYDPEEEIQKIKRLIDGSTRGGKFTSTSEADIN